MSTQKSCKADKTRVDRKGIKDMRRIENKRGKCFKRQILEHTSPENLHLLLVNLRLSMQSIYVKCTNFYSPLSSLFPSSLTLCQAGRCCLLPTRHLLISQIVEDVLWIQRVEPSNDSLKEEIWRQQKGRVRPSWKSIKIYTMCLNAHIPKNYIKRITGLPSQVFKNWSVTIKVFCANLDSYYCS